MCRGMGPTRWAIWPWVAMACMEQPARETPPTVPMATILVAPFFTFPGSPAIANRFRRQLIDVRQPFQHLRHRGGRALGNHSFKGIHG